MKRMLVALWLFGGLCTGWADQVTWLGGTTPPAEWTITPALPGPNDVITFSGPTAVFDNACLAEQALGGTPQLYRVPGTQVILLWFEGPPPQDCNEIYQPVAGLEGQIDPLPIGPWVLQGVTPGAEFVIEFSVVQPTVYRVDADAPGPVHDGMSWQTAFLSPQDALALAAAGDEIRVAAGTYHPDEGGLTLPGDRHASFVLPDGVRLVGGYAGFGEPNEDAQDPNAWPTVFSGDLLDNDLFGLLLLEDNSRHVVSQFGGQAVLEGVRVTAGQATGDFPDQFGGGVFVQSGALTLVDCILEANRADFGAAAAAIDGTLLMVNTVLRGNRATVLGGALYNQTGSVELVNVRIVGNAAGAASYSGSAAIQNYGGTLRLSQCTIVDNRVPEGRAIASFVWGLTPDAVRIVNSILRNGGNEVWSNQAPTIAYCNVEGGAAGPGNIDADPLFRAPGLFDLEGQWIDGDYRPAAGSPCIDTGSDANVPADVVDLDADGDVSEPLPLDLAGAARVQGAAVDMGAYEVTPEPPAGGQVLTFCVGSSCVPLSPDPNAPAGSSDFVGQAVLNVTLNFQAQLTAQVTATSPAGGTWTAWLDPSVVGPGADTTTLHVQGQGLDLGALPAGDTVQVAQVQVFAAPVP